MEKHLSRHTYGVLCCIAGAVSWGISGAISEAFFQRYTADPVWVTAVRMTAAGIFLMVWVTAKKQLCFGDLMKDKKSLFQIAAFSLAGLMLCQLAYLNAIRWTNSGTVTVLQNLSIVFVAVFLCITSKKLPEKPILIGIALALFGVWLISTGGTPGSMELTPKGLFWGLAAGLGAASYSLLSRRPVERWGSLPVTGMGMLIGGLVLSAAVRAWEIPAGLDLYALVLLSAIVLLGTVGAFSLFLQGIRMAGPMKASLLSCLEPLTAAFLSAFWLHSSFSAAELVGFACILATVFLIRE